MGPEEKLTLEKFEEACEAVSKVTLDTTLIYSDYFSERTGGKVYLKPENRQRTGAYKVRGAYYKISTLSKEERDRGLITASAGNHAQGVAYAAKQFGAKAVIVMPTTTPLIKVNRTKALGAEVVLHGDVIRMELIEIDPAPPRPDLEAEIRELRRDRFRGGFGVSLDADVPHEPAGKIEPEGDEEQPDGNPGPLPAERERGGQTVPFPDLPQAL